MASPTQVPPHPVDIAGDLSLFLWEHIVDSLVHLIYASVATRPLDSAELVELLENARTANAEIDVTGLLLYESGSFFQVIEGPEDVVLTIFARIQYDSRHQQIVKIIAEPIERRDFGDWTMAFAGPTREELSRIEGLNDFFTRGEMFASLGRGRAKRLLAAFRGGSWRRKLDASAPAMSC